jgi:hypothetical protein
MGFDWKQASEGSGRGPKLPVGKHEVRIEDIRYEGRSGPFISNGGDPQILVVFRDRNGNEVGQMMTLSEKAAWVLSNVMNACRPEINLSKMTTDGVEPKHFANQEFSDSVLLGRTLMVQVSEQAGKDGKLYPRVEPLNDPTYVPVPWPALEGTKPKLAGTGAASSKPATTIDEDSIPF